MRKNGNRERFSLRRLFAFLALALCSDCMVLLAQSQPRVIEILADHDSRYKMTGLKQPIITVKAGEEILLRITAKKAQNRNRDGSIHGFSLLRVKDRQPVPGWDLLLKPGTQEFTLTAPSDPGDYLVICTVICSPDHEQMNMKFVVES
jgi:heme/copper-type cytochrome/quinol oxidase subunit 2